MGGTWLILINRDVIVIGASAGGVEALQVLVSQLPSGLPASVFITLHIQAGIRSEMAAILSRAGPLPAIHPERDQRMERGVIYIAPPDHHVILEGDRVQLWRGPKENRHRPSINTLFRSAAICCRERVAGVILTGTLDDGSAGLWQIKRLGGVAIVQQDPRYSEMVQNALEYVEIDYMVKLSRMGSLLTALAYGTRDWRPEPAPLAGIEEVRKWKRKLP